MNAVFIYNTLGQDYFSFKQFTIQQKKCSLKVSTDSCILGAWFANKTLGAENILDIGSGTGLLMLMMAQKTTGTITGIEIESSCFEQLEENILNSPWKQRCSIVAGDVRNYLFNNTFDFIVSNPPFYEGQLESEVQIKNMAKHSSHLTLSELFNVVNRILSPGGKFGVLLPFSRKVSAIGIAKTFSLHCTEVVDIRQTPVHDFFRTILQFERQSVPVVSHNDLTIKESTGDYSSRFHLLLEDYYLFL